MSELTVTCPECGKIVGAVSNSRGYHYELHEPRKNSDARTQEGGYCLASDQLIVA